jgi:hypothetical protein
VTLLQTNHTHALFTVMISSWLLMTSIPPQACTSWCNSILSCGLGVVFSQILPWAWAFYFCFFRLFPESIFGMFQRWLIQRYVSGTGACSNFCFALTRRQWRVWLRWERHYSSSEALMSTALKWGSMCRPSLQCRICTYTALPYPSTICGATSSECGQPHCTPALALIAPVPSFLWKMGRYDQRAPWFMTAEQVKEGLKAGAAMLDHT